MRDSYPINSLDVGAASAVLVLSHAFLRDSGGTGCQTQLWRIAVTSSIPLVLSLKNFLLAKAVPVKEKNLIPLYICPVWYSRQTMEPLQSQGHATRAA